MYFYFFFFTEIIPFENGFKVKSNCGQEGLTKEKDEQGFYFWYSPLFENLDGAINFCKENNIYVTLP